MKEMTDLGFNERLQDPEENTIERKKRSPADFLQICYDELYVKGETKPVPLERWKDILRENWPDDKEVNGNKKNALSPDMQSIVGMIFVDKEFPHEYFRGNITLGTNETIDLADLRLRK